MDHSPNEATATASTHGGAQAGSSRRSTGQGGKGRKSGRGGARKGAGRPADASKAGRVMLSLELPAAEAARFRQVASSAGLTQSYLFSTLLSFLSLVENTAQVATTHKEAE
jgi:hypothetical protein